MARLQSTSIESEIQKCLRTYTITALKRTAHYGGNLPVNFNKLQQAAIVACGKNKKLEEEQKVGSTAADIEKAPEYFGKD